MAIFCVKWRRKQQVMPNESFDEIDRKILAVLQEDGRLTNAELADRVGLSPSPCLRRVKQLEAAGVIAGYGARLDRQKIGLGLTLFVGIKVGPHEHIEEAAFSAAVAALPEVISCHLVSGEFDFLVQIVVPDLAAYEKFLLGTLLKLPGVRDIRSNFAIRTVKAAAPLPLGHLA
jgi:Lrp/AsnC family leucine-responsive transcriptional regulator